MDIEKLKDIIQDSNINFLIGSGLSMPYLATLENIETLLTDLANDNSLSQEENEIIKSSIFSKFFEIVISKNPNILNAQESDSDIQEVLTQYVEFVNTLNTILLKRSSSLLNKQVNLFTTNIDVFLEKALENIKAEFNDGFSGRIRPIFSVSNFKKSVNQKSLQYDNTSEIPVFNLMKVHGSLNWNSDESQIVYSHLEEIETINNVWNKIKGKVIDFAPSDSIDHFKKEVAKLSYDSDYLKFLVEYEKLAIVNPTKEKFAFSVLNLNYYELLRIFSNEMEKENTLLFVLGFSMSDEHIREIIIRAANSNPTLIIYIVAFSESAKLNIENNIKASNIMLRYSNIEIVEPNPDEYNFKNINSNIFKKVLNIIEGE